MARVYSSGHSSVMSCNVFFCRMVDCMDQQLDIAVYRVIETISEYVWTASSLFAFARQRSQGLDRGGPCSYESVERIQN